MFLFYYFYFEGYKITYSLSKFFVRFWGNKKVNM